MTWLVVVLAGFVLVDSAVEIGATRRAPMPQALSSVRINLQWLNCGGVLACAAWFSPARWSARRLT